MDPGIVIENMFTDQKLWKSYTYPVSIFIKMPFYQYRNSHYKEKAVTMRIHIPGNIVFI